MKRQKILFLTPRFPYPLVGGDKIKSYYLLRHLAAHHDVVLVSLYEGKQLPAQYRSALEQLGIRVFWIPYLAWKAWTKAVIRIPTPTAADIACFYDPAMQRIVDRLVAQEHFDVAMAFFIRTAEYVKHLPMPKILLAEDCRTLYQTRSYQHSKSHLFHHIGRWLEVQKLRRYEAEIVNYFDIVTLVSKVDIEAMQKLNPHARYRLLINGVDVSNIPFRDEQQRRKDLIFIGKLDVWANVLMIKRLVQNILPKIWAKHPEVKLRIVGAYPPRILYRYLSDRVQLLPNVPKVEDFLYQAAVFLHPHSGGSGIQNKLLLAMATGCPIITTPTGNQGIGARHQQHAMVGESDEELAAYAIQLLESPQLRSVLVRNARRYVEKYFAWENVYRQMDSVLAEVLPDAATKVETPELATVNGNAVPLISSSVPEEIQ